MKSTLLMAVSLVALMSARMRADIIYSGLKDVVIPPDFTGVYLDVDTGVTGNNDNSPPAGWDVNPFFGGAGIANSPSFQPARLGNGTTDPILALSVGELISNMLSFSTGYGGSEGHMETEYVAGEEAYLAFKLTTNGPAASGPYFGWMRVILTEATAGAFIKDWAYENSGTPIVTGRVRQGPISNGRQVVTLSPGNGESFTLGSALTDTGGIINDLLKTGGGTTVLTGNNTYSGSTKIEGGILSISASSNLGNGAGTNLVSINGGTLRSTGTSVSLGVNRALAIGAGGATFDVTAGNELTLSGAITGPGSVLFKTGLGTLSLETAVGTGMDTVNASAGTTNIGVSQTLAALNIAAGAVVILDDSAPAPGAMASATQAIPEPGSLSMLLAGFLALISYGSARNRLTEAERSGKLR
jgi:autotransporter-associated beta strand protein